MRGVRTHGQKGLLPQDYKEQLITHFGAGTDKDKGSFQKDFQCSVLNKTFLSLASSRNRPCSKCLSIFNKIYNLF